MKIPHRDVNRFIIPSLVNTEQAMEWGSHLTAREHATLVQRQRAVSKAALAECHLEHKVHLAMQSQLMREAADAFEPV